MLAWLAKIIITIVMLKTSIVKETRVSMNRQEINREEVVHTMKSTTSIATNLKAATTIMHAMAVTTMIITTNRKAELQLPAWHKIEAMNTEMAHTMAVETIIMLIMVTIAVAIIEVTMLTSKAVRTWVATRAIATIATKVAICEVVGKTIRI